MCSQTEKWPSKDIPILRPCDYAKLHSQGELKPLSNLFWLVQVAQCNHREFFKVRKRDREGQSEAP